MCLIYRCESILRDREFVQLDLFNNLLAVGGTALTKVILPRRNNRLITFPPTLAQLNRR